MSREYFAPTWDFTNQANFTTFAGGVHNGVLNRGWIQTSDTGQCDPTTVTVPAADTFAGYCIYRTNDGVGDVFYLRVDYGRENNTDGPRFKCQLGTGTNGAGTLTGNVSSAFDMISQGAGSSVLSRMLVAGDAGRLTILLGADNRTGPGAKTFCALGRTVDSTGTPNARGMELFTNAYGGLNTWRSQFVPAASYSSVVPSVTLINSMISQSSTEWIYDTSIFFAHPFTTHKLDSNYPSPNVVSWFTGHFPENGQFLLTSYGTEKEYFFFSYGGFVNSQMQLAPRID